MDMKTMRQGGEHSMQCVWSDEALDLAIRCSRLAWSFLAGKGPQWWLASSKLRQELESLELMQAERMRK